MKKLIRRVAHALGLGFALAIGTTAAADAQGINDCLDVAGEYNKRFVSTLDPADANHCQAYQEAISWESKAVQQFRACLPGAQPGRQADLVTKAMQAAERALAKAHTAARLDGCTVQQPAPLTQESLPRREPATPKRTAKVQRAAYLCLAHCLAVIRSVGGGPGSAGWNECYRQVTKGTSFCHGR